MPIADDLADEFTARDLQLNRLAESERRKIFSAITKLEGELIEALRKVDPTKVARETFRRRRMKALLDLVSPIIRNGYGAIGREQKKVLRQVARLEADQATKIINNAIGFDAMNITPEPETLRALADDTLVEGAVVQAWWKKKGDDTREMFANEMRAGLFAQEDFNSLMQRVRGTRANRFQDGITGIQRRSAERIVRTSVNSVSNNAREQTFSENEDIMKGVQALATLDTRTSPICMARAGSAWNLNTRKALPESPRKEDYPGPPPWHWRCRTVMNPVLKSYEDLLGSQGKQFDKALEDLGPGTRSSMDGQIAGDTTFHDWFERQGEGRQKTLLGAGRLKLYQGGKLKLKDLVDQRGHPLTIDQLIDLDGGGGGTGSSGGGGGIDFEAARAAVFERHPKLAELGDSLYMETDIEASGVASILEDMEQIDANILKALKDNNIQVYIGEGPVTGIDDMGHLKGVQPRGWPPGSTWDQVGGLFNPQNNRVVVGTGMVDGSKSTILHEMGHAVDRLLDDLSNRRVGWLESDHIRLFPKLNQYLQQGGPGGRVGMAEMFAETFAEYHLKSKKWFIDKYDADYATHLKHYLEGIGAPVARRQAPWVPATTIKEVHDRMGRIFTRGGRLGVEGDLDTMNEILHGLEDTLGKYGVAINELQYQKRGQKSIGRAGGQMGGKAGTMWLQKTFVKQGKKKRIERMKGEHEKWERIHKDNIRRSEQGIKGMRDGIKAGNIRNSAADLAKMEARHRKLEGLRYWIAAEEATGDPLYGITKHEAYHLLDYSQGWTVSTELMKRLRAEVPEHILAQFPGEYGSSSAREMFTELGTAIDLGLEVPEQMKAVFQDVVGVFEK